jgi:sarcosine oxidase subunit delta
MSFLIPCPNCGPRAVDEFRFGGEMLSRPSPQASERDWSSYFYSRRNLAGEQTEWWYHKFGCRRWLIAERDTVSNSVSASRWPQQRRAGG